MLRHCTLARVEVITLILQQMDSTLDLLNPYHRVQEDTRKRLGKYGLVNSALDVLGVWTLAHVKLARTDEEL